MSQHDKLVNEKIDYILNMFTLFVDGMLMSNESARIYARTHKSIMFYLDEKIYKYRNTLRMYQKLKYLFHKYEMDIEPLKDPEMPFILDIFKASLTTEGHGENIIIITTY